MCAIAGLVGLDAEEKTLDRMLKTMARRGPDDRTGKGASHGSKQVLRGGGTPLHPEAKHGERNRIG